MLLCRDYASACMRNDLAVNKINNVIMGYFPSAVCGHLNWCANMPAVDSVETTKSFFYYNTEFISVFFASGAHTLVHTKGNGSSSSLVKQLKSYYEESIRGAQH